jgi:O-antigen/teichoic acid export membrane protein
MSSSVTTSTARWSSWLPSAARASALLRAQAQEQRTALFFTLAVIVLNLATLLGNALAFRWVDPASMGVWHTLLLLSSYLGVVRFGVINGMGRDLPFALGRGDLALGRRLAATTLAFNNAGAALVGALFIVLLPVFWAEGTSWRLALPAIAVLNLNMFYLGYLQATFRSDSDFGRLARVHWVQAGTAALLPVLVSAFGFVGLCVHAVLQSTIVTAYAHAVRPMAVRPHFEPALARQLFATGFPLFLATYLQTAAVGFDRVILLSRGTVETVGYYAPALAVLSAMGIVPGAVAAYVYPRMSYALGQGKAAAGLRGMAFRAALVSLAAGVPVAAAGWFAAPPVIERFFPQYVASVPAVRWSLVSGLLWSVSPAANVLGSLKAWKSLGLYVGVLVAARWLGPWTLSGVYEPLEGVARGNALAAGVVGALSLALVWGATRGGGEP